MHDLTRLTMAHLLTDNNIVEQCKLTSIKMMILPETEKLQKSLPVLTATNTLSLQYHIHLYLGTNSEGEMFYHIDN